MEKSQGALDLDPAAKDVSTLWRLLHPIPPAGVPPPHQAGGVAQSLLGPMAAHSSLNYWKVSVLRPDPDPWNLCPEQELMSWTQIRTKNRDSDQKARVFRLRSELSPHNPLHPSAHNLKALTVNCPLFSYKGKSTGQPPYLRQYMESSSG